MEVEDLEKKFSLPTALLGKSSDTFESPYNSGWKLVLSNSNREEKRRGILKNQE